MREEAAREEAVGGASAMKWPLIGSAAGHLALVAFLLIFLRASSGPGFPAVVQVVLLEAERTGDSPGGRAVARASGGVVREDSGIPRPPQSGETPERVSVGGVSPESAAGRSTPNIASPVASSSGGAPSFREAAARATPAASGPPPTAAGPPRGIVGDAGKRGGGEGPEIRLLRERIESRIVYPADAIRRGQEGEVLLRIRVGEGGVPREIRVARSSGARTLDEAARNGVTQAAPLPSRPGWFEVPVRFRLR